MNDSIHLILQFVSGYSFFKNNLLQLVDKLHIKFSSHALDRCGDSTECPQIRDVLYDPTDTSYDKERENYKSYAEIHQTYEILH